MKKCDYCAKEISYHQQYCDEECEKKALDFYSLREKYTKTFSVLNIICLFGIPVGLFISAFRTALGISIVSYSFMLLGITIIILPFPVENMITSMKIKKAMSVTRIVGGVLLLIGIGSLIFRIIFL